MEETPRKEERSPNADESRISVPIVEVENEMAEITANRYETEQSAVFTDYRTESIEKGIGQYGSLSIYERMGLVKNIDSIRQLIGPSPSYFSWLEHLAADNEEIQRYLLTFLRERRKVDPCPEHCHEQFVLPLTRIAVGSYSQLKEESCSLLCSTLQSSIQDLPTTLGLTYTLAQQEAEESKTTSLYLASGLGQLIAEGERPKLFQLCCCGPYSKASVKLKKEIIQHCSMIARGQAPKFIDEDVVTGFFLERCREPIWAIRKACVESLPELVPLSHSKKEALTSCLMAFTKDGSKIVRLTAFKKVPQFLAKYGSEKIPSSLFELYSSLLTHPINKQLNRDAELLEKVSFFFPGAVQICGPSRWPKLNEMMLRILKSKSKEVKMPIASSLHHLAQSIKPSQAEKYLFPVADQLLKEESEDIKIAVLKVFPMFLEVFEERAREQLIDFFLVLQKDSKRWRIRNQIACQLGSLASLYSSDVNFQVLLPITLRLCNDTHSQVRSEAASHAHEVILRISSEQGMQAIAIESIVHLAQSSVCVQRLTFCLMVQKMLLLDDFRQKSQELLLELARDPVVGVRAGLAHSLRAWSTRPQVQSILSPVVLLLASDQEDCVSLEMANDK